MIRRRRPLTSEERRLWAEVARSVVPLDPGKAAAAEPAATPAPAAPETPQPDTTKTPQPRIRAARVAAPPKPVLPPLAPVERTTIRALARGRRRADAVLDLHGLRQSEAHAALNGFLRRAQAAGHALVLVVTGKGGAASAEPGERGVLRRVVPHWLGLPELRGVVLGFDEAGRHQGGEGALYVRIRRVRARP